MSVFIFIELQWNSTIFAMDFMFKSHKMSKCNHSGICIFSATETEIPNHR